MRIPLLLLGNGSLKYVTVALNKHAATEELLDTLFSMWSVSYQEKQAISSSQNFLFLNITLYSQSNTVTEIQ
jgi:hypothetical protein